MCFAPDETGFRAVECAGCGGEGHVTWWTGGMDYYGNPIEDGRDCKYCDGTGGEIIETEPVDLNDLIELESMIPCPTPFDAYAAASMC